MARGARWVAASGLHPAETFLFDGETGEQVHKFPRGGGELAFSPDGRWLIASASQAMHAVDVETGCVRWSRPRQEGGNQGGGVAAFPRDGRFMSAGPSRSEIGLYETATGREVARFGLTDGGHLSSICLGGESVLALGSTDHVQLWDLNEVDRRLRDLGLDLGLGLGEPPAGPAASSIEVPSRAGPIALAPPSWSDWKEKLVGLTLLIQGEPDAAEPYERRAGAFLERGQRQEALADLARALERNPRQPALVHLRRAQVLEGLGQLEECLADLNRGLELEPALLDALRLRASVLDRLGREADAVQDLERALAQSPDDPHALEALAWILLTGPRAARDPGRALEPARKAAAQKPELVYAQRTQGMACYRAGLIDEARAALERVLGLPGGIAHRRAGSCCRWCGPAAAMSPARGRRCRTASGESPSPLAGDSWGLPTCAGSKS